MKSLLNRVLAPALMGVLALLLLAAAAAPVKNASNLQPDKIVIVTTSDVKGKTSPCG